MASIEDDDLMAAEIERRREPRGMFPGLTLSFAGKTFPVDEASRRGLFLSVEKPEAIPLGSVHDATLAYEGEQVALRVEVVRKEIDPRCGVAVLVVHTTPEAAAGLKRLLEVSEVPRE